MKLSETGMCSQQMVNLQFYTNSKSSVDETQKIHNDEQLLKQNVYSETEIKINYVREIKLYIGA